MNVNRTLRPIFISKGFLAAGRVGKTGRALFFGKATVTVGKGLTNPRKKWYSIPKERVPWTDWY